MSKLTKQDMEALIMAKFGLDRAVSRAIVSTLLDSMSETLANGGKVILKGVGTLHPKHIPEKVHNGFGKSYIIPQSWTIDFTISDTLNRKVKADTEVIKADSLSKFLKSLLEN